MNHPIHPHKMPSSPPNSHLTSLEPSNDCNVTSLNSFEIASLDPLDNYNATYSEPEMCYCENQLAHYDWAGVIHEDLPELCR